MGVAAMVVEVAEVMEAVVVVTPVEVAGAEEAPAVGAAESATQRVTLVGRPRVIAAPIPVVSAGETARPVPRVVWAVRQAPARLLVAMQPTARRTPVALDAATRQATAA